MDTLFRPSPAWKPAFPAGVFAMAAVVAACGDASPGREHPADPTVTDSAGITLVRNGVVPLWSPEEAWWVEETLRIGGDPSAPETVFGFVADVATDPAGRIYVLDREARAVRVFGPDGDLLRTLDAPGDEPGQDGEAVTSVVVADGEVRVPDGARGRVHRWDTDGASLPSLPLPVAPGTRTWWDATREGVVYFRALALPGDGEGPGSAVDRLYRFRGDGTAEAVLEFEYPSPDPETLDDPGVPAVVNAPAWAVLSDGSVAWTTLDAAEIRVRRPDGTQVRIRSGSWLQHEPGEAERTLLARLMADRARMEGGTAVDAASIPVRFPRHLPVLTDLHAGPEGTIWVQRPGPLRDVHPMAMSTPDSPRGWGGSTWEILSSDGRYLGSLELPPRVRVMWVGEDAVIGVASDLRRVDHVVVLALHRPAPAP